MTSFINIKRFGLAAVGAWLLYTGTSVGVGAIQLDDYRQYVFDHHNGLRDMEVFFGKPAEAKSRLAVALDHISPDRGTHQVEVDRYFEAFSIYFSMLNPNQNWDFTDQERGFLVELLSDEHAWINARFLAATVLYIDSGEIGYMVQALRLNPNGFPLYLHVRDNEYETIVSVLLSEALAWSDLSSTYSDELPVGVSSDSQIVLQNAYTSVSTQFLTIGHTLVFQNVSRDFYTKFLKSWPHFLRGGHFPFGELLDLVQVDPQIEQSFLSDLAMDPQKYSIFSSSLDENMRARIVDAVMRRLEDIQVE